MNYGYINLIGKSSKYDFFAKELEDYKPTKIYCDENDNGDDILPQLNELLNTLKEKDELTVHSCLMLSEDETTLQTIISMIRNKGAKLRLLDLSSHGMENPIDRKKRLLAERRKG